MRDLGIFAVLSMLQAILSCWDCRKRETYWIIAFFTFLMWIFLWKGNSMLTNYINTKISWFHHPVKRFFVGLVSTIGYTLVAIIGLLRLNEWAFDFDFGSSFQSTVYICIIITVLISLFLHSRQFLIMWRKTKFDAERLEKESISARYESLKSQVNPHFLFNSLNALTNLVYEDPDKAVKFIKQLSEVYRYVLDTRDKEVVPLKDELSFLRSYNYLQQIRFGDKLKIDITLLEDGTLIAPLALQMLIENAIKHNIVSEDDPLNIRIYEQDGYIVVSNNLQRKLSSSEPSAGVGLDNICKRYEFLSVNKVIISIEEGQFRVKLPVIKDIAS